jgi:iron complex outermembrane receptor protein
VLASAFAAQGASSQSVDQLAPLQKSQPRDTVVITAGGSQMELPVDYAGGQIARGGRVGLFGNLDLMDTPFSATSYTAELIAAQQASSVADVVQADSAVRVARGSGNFQELYVVRGSPVYSDDVSYNGLYGLMPRQYVATEFLERVEVFRGANTFLNGAAPSGSGIGGAINLVPKHAPDERIDRLTLGFENESQGFGAADF